MSTSTQGELRWFRAGDLQPWPGLNPRTHESKQKDKEMLESVRTGGVRTPISVGWEVGTDASKAPLVVAGFRRWRAATEVDPDMQIPAHAKFYTPQEALATALLENLQREDLTPLEKADGFKRLMAAGWTQNDIGSVVGFTGPAVSNYVRLLELPENMQKRIDDGKVDPTAARDFMLPFVKLSDPYRERFFAKLAQSLDAAAKDVERLSRAQVRKVVQDVALDRSNPVTATALDAVRPLFDPKLHRAKCGCGGPSFDYGTGEREVRCFNLTWWKQAQKEAQEKNEKQARVQQETATKKAASAPVETITEQERDRYPVGALVDLVASHASLDPDALAGAKMVVLDTNGDRKVFVNDGGKVAEAKASAGVKLKERIDEIARQRGQKDREVYANQPNEGWMYAEVLKARPGSDVLFQIGREIGLPLGENAAAVAEALPKLDEGQALLLFRVVAARSQRGDLGLDALTAKARESLAAEWADKIDGLVQIALKESDKKPRRRPKEDEAPAQEPATTSAA